MAEEPAQSQLTADLERTMESIPTRLRSARATFTLSTHRSEALFALLAVIRAQTPPPVCSTRSQPGNPEQSGRGKTVRSSPPEETERVDWAFNGDRFYRNSESDFWGQRIDVFDGERNYIFQESTIPGFTTSPQGSVRAKRMQFTSPLDFGYCIEGRWIFDVLKGGDTVIMEREKDPIFGDILAVQSVQRDGNVYRLWFAVDRGYMAVRADYEQHNTGDPARWYTTRMRCSRAIEDNGVWFPMSGTAEKFQVLSDDVEHPAPFISRDYSATSAQVNHAPKSLFKMRFPPGTVVWDAVDRKKYYIDANGASVAGPGTVVV